MGGGQEQYKVEIGVCNTNLFDGEWESGAIDNRGEPMNNSVLKRSKNFIHVISTVNYVIKVNETGTCSGFIYNYDKNKIFISRQPYYGNISFTLPPNARYIKIVPDGKYDGFRLNVNKVDDYIPHKSHKQTILLPCQLMKVGDVKDRLYWDVDKGKYMIEKNVYEFSYKDLESSTVKNAFNNILTYCYIIINDKLHTKNLKQRKNINSFCKTEYVNSLYKDEECYGFEYNGGYITFRISQSKIGEKPSATDLYNYFKSIEFKMYYTPNNPELIETNITERIELPCYNPITHIIVNSGNIEPSNVKALVPMKGIDWDYEKKFDAPVNILNLWEYVDGRNINLNIFSNNQVLEIDIYDVNRNNMDPQIMLLSSNFTGGKVYWDQFSNNLCMTNNPNFGLELKYPCKLKVTLINNIFSLYVNEILQTRSDSGTSNYLNFTGIQLKEGGSMNITGFRYKNFNRGE